MVLSPHLTPGQAAAACGTARFRESVPPHRPRPAESEGAATRVEMRTVFPIKELRDETVQKYHAIEGGQQTLNILAAYVSELAQERTEG